MFTKLSLSCRNTSLQSILNIINIESQTLRSSTHKKPQHPPQQKSKPTSHTNQDISSEQNSRQTIDQRLGYTGVTLRVAGNASIKQCQPYIRTS